MATESTKPLELLAKAAALRREKAESDAIFHSIGVGAIVTDSSGNISRVNNAALRILGVKRKDIIGKWYPATVVAEDEKGRIIPFIERPIAEVFISGKPVFRKFYFLKADGTRVAVAVTISPIMINNKPRGAIEIFRDITEEVKLEQAKDEFISLASHQLRTPATGVKQYLSMLLDGYAGDLTEAQRRFAMIAHESNDRQLRIIDDLLKVAAADSGNVTIRKTKVNIVSLVRQVIDEQLSNFVAKNQKISVHSSSPTIYAKIDKNTFRMALDNLIDNAHKYTFIGKCIKVSIRELKTSVKIEIKDEGTGIDQVDFDKLFQKFSRLNNPLSIASGGTGIGLYWVKQIVDLHGGSIRVNSELGRGSAFTITLYK